MPLVPTADLMDQAVREDSAVLAFNIITLEHAEAVAQACEAAKSPAILAVSHNAVRYHRDDPAPLLGAAAAIARRCDVPLALHLDHVEDEDLVLRARELGCGSVMFDASRLPHSDNVARTAAVTARLHDESIWVEAELGEIGGKDGVHCATARTDPDEAAEYVRATGIDALAVAVGSTHAMTERNAMLDQDLIARLRAAVDVPLVLHGSSGVPDQEIRSAITHGMRKINFGTHLSAAFTRAIRAGLDDYSGVDPRRYLAAGREAVAAATEQQLRLLTPEPVTP